MRRSGLKGLRWVGNLGRPYLGFKIGENMNGMEENDCRSLGLSSSLNGEGGVAH